MLVTGPEELPMGQAVKAENSGIDDADPMQTGAKACVCVLENIFVQLCFKLSVITEN